MNLHFGEGRNSLSLLHWHQLGWRISEAMFSSMTDGWCWLSAEILAGFCWLEHLYVASPRGLGLLTAWWLGSTVCTPREKTPGGRGIAYPWKSSHPFYHILLIEAVPNAHTRSRGSEIDSISWWGMARFWRTWGTKRCCCGPIGKTQPLT